MEEKSPEQIVEGYDTLFSILRTEEARTACKSALIDLGYFDPKDTVYHKYFEDVAKANEDKGKIGDAFRYRKMVDPIRASMLYSKSVTSDDSTSMCFDEIDYRKWLRTIGEASKGIADNHEEGNAKGTILEVKEGQAGDDIYTKVTNREYDAALDLFKRELRNYDITDKLLEGITQQERNTNDDNFDELVSFCEALYSDIELFYDVDQGIALEVLGNVFKRKKHMLPTALECFDRALEAYERTEQFDSAADLAEQYLGSEIASIYRGIDELWRERQRLMIEKSREETKH